VPIRRNIFVSCCLLLILAFSIGCSSDKVELGQVTGTVLMDETPVAGARVVFTPEEGRRSVGVTNASGIYKLEFSEDAPGAVLGTHSVSIEWTGEDPEEDEMAEATDDDPGSGSDGQEVFIPAKYNVRTTLTALVESGDNVHDFSLTSF